MKTLIRIIKNVVLTAVLVVSASAMSFGQNPSNDNPIRIWSNSQLEGITAIWISEYSEVRPDANITMIPRSEMHGNMINEPGTIGLVSSDYLKELKSNSDWRMVVGREIIVPVTSAANPYLGKIGQHGISLEKFALLSFSSGKIPWGTLLENDIKKPVNYYFINDENVAAYLDNFMQINPGQLRGKEFQDVDDMLHAIQKDKFALGFCKLVDLLNDENGEIDEAFAMIPVDKNGNNTIDQFENIYDNSSELTRGAWIGKYPGELNSKIYIVAALPPTGSEELAFLDWVLTEGQEYLNGVGYMAIVSGESKTKLQRLHSAGIPIADIEPRSSGVTNVLIVLTIVGAFIIILYLVFSKQYEVEDKGVRSLKVRSVITENSLKAPGGLFFDNTHAWTFMEKSGDVRAGIDDFIQHVTGPVTKIILKNPGENIKKGEPFISLIQQGKKLVLNAPVSGVIKAHNSQLISDPSLINESPYNEGWVYVIEPANWLKETRAYLMGESYKDWLKQEFIRLKDFLSGALLPGEGDNKLLIMQDGGELRDCILECMDPEIWEEFQSDFIDKMK